MNPFERYTPTAQILHWLVAGLIVVQFCLAKLAEDASTIQKLILLANHKSVGMTVLLLAVIRVMWRVTHKAPTLINRGWQARTAKATHATLYLLIFALPLSGWLMSSANAYSVSWFNLITLPDLVNPDEMLMQRLQDLHHLLGNILLALALIHLTAALKHHFWDKDTVLMRMLSVTGTSLFIVVIIASLLFLLPTKPPPQAKAPMAQPANADIANQTPSTPARAWTIDMKRSSVIFRAEQAGATFDGRWTDWQADVTFDPHALSSSTAHVIFNTHGVDTRDSERDETLRSAEFFATADFPTVVFHTDEITAGPAGGYVAQATLTIKNQVHPVTFEFEVENNAGVAHLTGRTNLDRLAVGVGTGEWLDTTWIGQIVGVRVELWTLPVL